MLISTCPTRQLYKHLLLCQTNVILLSELHNYINLVCLVFVQHYYVFRLSISAIIRYKEILVYKKSLSFSWTGIPT